MKPRSPYFIEEDRRASFIIFLKKCTERQIDDKGQMTSYITENSIHCLIAPQTIKVSYSGIQGGFGVDFTGKKYIGQQMKLESRDFQHFKMISSVIYFFMYFK